MTCNKMALLQGYFFNQEESAPSLPSQAQEDALTSETASLGLAPETKFYSIHTAWIALLQLILFVSVNYSGYVFYNDVHVYCSCFK